MWKILFSLVTLTYIWWIYFLLVISDNKKYKNYEEPVSVIIPCYNEPRRELLGCIRSIVRCNGEKQIILVNNNSKLQETLETFKEIRKIYPEIKFLNENKQGKRFAHGKGLKYAKHELIVFVDSDTILEKNAIFEIVKPFHDKDVGGCTGQMLLSNKDDNLVSRCINAMFWTSSNIFRRASSSMGFMQVMPGALSCYRKVDLKKLEKDYLNQTFLGRPCSISDDRFMTMRIQTRLNKKIVYNDKAIAYTYIPGNIFTFWKIMERWRRGMIREVLLLWKEPKKNAKLLFFDTQFNFIIFNIMVFFKLVLIYNIIFNFSLINLAFVVGWFAMMTTLYGSYMVVHNPKEFIYKIGYSFIYEFFWMFTYFEALVRIRNQGTWGTR